MPVTYSWFVNTDPNNPTSPISYIITSSAPVCEGTVRVCAIYAQVDSNNKPIITTALNNEIPTTIDIHTNSTNVRLKH